MTNSPKRCQLRVRAGIRMVIALVAVLAQGCGPKALPPLDAAQIDHLKDEPVIQTIHYPPPDFFVDTSGRHFWGVLTGPLGLIAEEHVDRQQGTEMWKKYELQDPTVTVESRFLSALKTQWGLGNFRPYSGPLEDVANDDLMALQKNIGNGTVLDFKTIALRLIYIRFHQDRYQIEYVAHARLIRVGDSHVSWEGTCNVAGTGNDWHKAPTFEQVQADNGRWLKELLVQAADVCSNQLLAQFTGAKNAAREEDAGTSPGGG